VTFLKGSEANRHDLGPAILVQNVKASASFFAFLFVVGLFDKGLQARAVPDGH
jgi:hypothetical protein